MLKSKITGKQNYSLRFANVRHHKLTPEKVLFPSALIQSLASDYAEIDLLKHLDMKKNSQLTIKT